MKKRISYILCSIMCVLLTVSLVIYTIVVSTGSGVTGGPTITDPVDISGGNSGNLDSTSISRAYIVGDVVDDSILNANYSQIGNSLFEYDATQNALIAKNEGTQTFQVVNSNVVYNYAVSVWAKGDGSEFNPFNIVRASDLVKLVGQYNDVNTYYVQRTDLDLSSYATWTPIGTYGKPFAANYDGNGYSVNNMKIIVDETNVNSLLANAVSNSNKNLKVFAIGFFGCVNGGPEGRNSITNLNMDNALIDTTAIDEANVRKNITIDHCYIGVLAGVVFNSNISGEGANCNSTIYSSTSCDNNLNPYGCVSGVIGTMYSSSLTGYNVLSTINANGVGSVDADGVVYGTRIAGATGLCYKSTIDNMNIELSSIVSNYPDTSVSGIAFYEESGRATGVTSTISNCSVNKLDVDVNRVLYADGILCIKISGAVDTIIDEDSVIKNCDITGIEIDSVGMGQVSGIATFNYGRIVDCYVSGNLYGTIVAGVTYCNNTTGSIEYTNSYSRENAVDVVIKAQTRSAGIAIYNFGNITGADSLTTIKAQMQWSKIDGSIFLRNGETIENKYMFAGLAVYNAQGTISNFMTLVNMYDVINAAGAVGYLGDKSFAGESYTGGTLNNLFVNTTVRTLMVREGKSYSGKTSYVGGLVAFVKGSTKVSLIDVYGNISVNNKILENELYPIGTFGGIIAVVDGVVEINKVNGQVVSQSYDMGSKLYTNCVELSTSIKADFGKKTSNAVITTNAIYEVANNIVAE